MRFVARNLEQQAAHFAAKRRERGLRFVKRMYVPRIVGLATGALAIAPVLWTNGSHPVVWFLLWLAAFVWPHIAYSFGVSSEDPHRTELRSLMVDSVLGGMFIALMKFNVLPSALILVTLSMDKLAVGGVKLLARCTLALVAACLATAWLTGFGLRLETNMLEVYGSLPHLFVYPLAVGWTAYRMARRVRYQNQQLEALSRTDGLSQLLTRQAWEQVVAEEFDLCRRTGVPGSILLIDIDNLQAVNDELGYPAGDEVIRSVAMIVRRSIRPNDVPARYGGEEFAVLLPAMDLARAEETAELIRASVSASILEQSARLHGTVTIGIAQVQPHNSGFREWIGHAHTALHSGKKKGGNRTSRYSVVSLVQDHAAAAQKDASSY